MGRVANVVARWVLQRRELLAKPDHGLHGFVNREGGLRQPNEFLRVAHANAFNGYVDNLDLVWSLTGGSFYFFVTFVADQQNVVILFGKALNLAVNLGHQRAGGVDGVESTSIGGGNDGRRNTVSREN